MPSRQRIRALPAAYRPAVEESAGFFLALEGVSGSGKSTLAKLLAEQWGCPQFHTAPGPLSSSQGFVNSEVEPLPHLMFYLMAAMHVSDRARRAAVHGPVIADRYIGSVVASHAAVRRVPITDTQAMVAPYLAYFLRPTVTVYLHTPASEIRKRLAEREANGGPVRGVPSTDHIDRVQAAFDLIAAGDPTAQHLNTEGSCPGNLADAVRRLLPLADLSR